MMPDDMGAEHRSFKAELIPHHTPMRRRQAHGWSCAALVRDFA
jgi:hypothetical protein